MNRIAAATLALAFALTGCTGSPKANLTPQAPPTPVHYIPLEPEPAENPEPTPTAPSVIPGTNLTAGPEPGTVLSDSGTTLRLIPTDPARKFRCRPATATERRHLDLAVGEGVYSTSKPIRAVDLSEGYSVVAYWDYVGGRSLIISGQRFTTLGTGENWHGTHTHAGLAFADGPTAAQAARECIK